MWPWEHLAIGYVIYSLGRRALGRDPPTDGDLVAIVVATQLPDLVDKPLSWGLGWFPSGYAVGHSVVFGVLLSLLVVGATARAERGRGGTPGANRGRLAVAFLVGYWSHLLGDVVSPLRSGDGVLVSRVLWPFSRAEPYAVDRGLGRGIVYFEGFVAELAAMDPLSALLLYGLVPLATVALWVLDGLPGTAIPARTVGWLRARN